MNKLKPKTIRHAATLAVCALATLTSSLTSYAAPTGSPAYIAELTLMKDLGLLEDRFFSRQFANDPVEKRLERLELLVFGATQDGANEQRYARLKKSISTRSENKSAAGPNSGSTGSGSATKSAPETASKYPVLNTLEWRALKKTFPSETLDQRLARVERKLFGQDSPGMPYFDRVERLKRTLGIGVTAAAPTGPMGPAPKARPRGTMGLDGFFDDPTLRSFGSNPRLGGGMFGDEQFGMQPPRGMQMPGGMFGNEQFGMQLPRGMQMPGGMTSAFAELFADMQKQMAELENLAPNLGPGSWVFDPSTGSWVEQNSGRRSKPNQKGNLLPKTPAKPHMLPTPRQPQLPHQFFGDDNTAIPPYADPNMI